MIKINSTLLKGVEEFITTYYSNLYGCIVSGSHVNGQNNEYSDIDVLVFTKDRNTVFNETLNYKDLKIQTIIIPTQNIQEFFWVDYIMCKGAFINMISKGYILFDTKNYLKDLISHSKELELLGGKPLSDKEVYMNRVKITSLLFDIMGGSDIDELMCSIASILDLITEFKLKINGNWCGDGKYRMRHIKKLDPVFHSSLVNAIQQVYGYKNKVPLVHLITDLLNENGGLLPYYSKANSLSKVIDDYLVIEIENNSNKKNIINTIKNLKGFIGTIPKNDINHYFFSSKPIGKNKIEQNIYMVIEADKDFLNDYLIDRINFFIENKKELSRLLFPYQFDPIYRFSNKTIYNQVTSLFFEVSKLITKKPENIFNQSFQLFFSLTLMRGIKKIWFNNDSKRFISFLEYLIDCWLVFSYDDGLNYKTEGLLRNRKLILKKFESMYKNQREDLFKIYFTKGGFDEKVINLLKNVAKIDDVKSIPLYRAYLMNDEFNDNDKKQKISLYREVVFKLLSICFIDNRLISYIPFIVKKIELND